MNPDPTSQAVAPHRPPVRKRRRKVLAGGLVALAVVAGAGLLGGQPFASAAADVTFDSGSGMTFVVSVKNGNMTSLKHNGAELAAPGQAAGQFESGFSSGAGDPKHLSHKTNM